MQQEPPIAIVMLNWNGFADTAECLQSLRQTAYRNYRTILVDNGSAGDEGFRLKEQFPEICLIRNEVNRGFAGGCNDGISRALSDGAAYVVTLNNDCLVERDWLGNLVSGLLRAGADFASARIMYYPETDLICSDGDGLLPDGTGYIVNPLQHFQAPGELRPIFSACGAGAIFSARCLQAVRLGDGQFFDELFFAYFEDIDLGARLHALSFKGVSVPDAVIYHKESKAAGQRSFFKIYQSERNRMLVELLNFPLYLVLLGEGYYLVRTLTRNARKLSAAPRHQEARPQPAKNFSPWRVLLASRWWVLRHLPQIWKSRRERKARGMVTRRILRHVCWDPARLLSAKLG